MEQVTRTRIATRALLECHSRKAGQSIALSPLLASASASSRIVPSHHRTTCAFEQFPYRPTELSFCFVPACCATLQHPLCLSTRSLLCVLLRTPSSLRRPTRSRWLRYLQTYTLRTPSLASGAPANTSGADSRTLIFPCRHTSPFLDLCLGSRLPCPPWLRHHRQSHPTPSYPPAAAAQTQKQHFPQP